MSEKASQHGCLQNQGESCQKLNQCQRKKRSRQDPADPVAVASCSTQTEEASNLDLVQLEYDKAVRVLQLAKFAQKVVSADGIADDFEYEEDNDDDDNDFDVCNDY